jgi:insertion element IS1 protein InsB
MFMALFRVLVRSTERFPRLPGMTVIPIFCTDHWKVYASVFPPEKLVMSKANTLGIERNHCHQRHWFGRFKRKSIMVSKAKAMVELTIALFARFRVNGNVSEIFTLDMIT